VETFGRILPQHFCTLVIGRPGSGKSHLLYEMIDNPDLYFKKFNFVYFITPGKIGDLALDQENSCKTFDLRWVYDKIEKINRDVREL
jgi:DNA replication protein DnaC